MVHQAEGTFIPFVRSFRGVVDQPLMSGIEVIENSPRIGRQDDRMKDYIMKYNIDIITLLPKTFVRFACRRKPDETDERVFAKTVLLPTKAPDRMKDRTKDQSE